MATLPTTQTIGHLIALTITRIRQTIVIMDKVMFNTVMRTKTVIMDKVMFNTVMRTKTVIMGKVTFTNPPVNPPTHPKLKQPAANIKYNYVQY